jgi:preprotein translocase subunit Sss1
MSVSSKDTLAEKARVRAQNEIQRFLEASAPECSDVAEVAKRPKKRPGSRA